MRFAIGYQLPDEDDSTLALVGDFRGRVAEVYFALPRAASGRSPLACGDGWSVAEANEVMHRELAELADMEVRLTLLLNAACYGRLATSRGFADEIQKTVSNLRSRCHLDSVTTTSIFIADVIRARIPAVKVRASVNMCIGSVPAIEQLAGRFDGFYLRRELNRHPAAIHRLKQWCDDHDKSLHLLANSGCLYDCAFQRFHDNLVAHEAEISRTDTVPTRYPAPCWEYLDDPARWPELLTNTWIRPEDVHHYETWFEAVKLATRMHSQPRKVLGAYARGRYYGNLLDLLEPGHGPLLPGRMLDNTAFPADWHERVTSCTHECDTCNYCRDVFRQVCKPVSEAKYV